MRSTQDRSSHLDAGTRDSWEDEDWEPTKEDAPTVEGPADSWEDEDWEPTKEDAPTVEGPTDSWEDEDWEPTNGAASSGLNEAGGNHADRQSYIADGSNDAEQKSAETMTATPEDAHSWFHDLFGFDEQPGNGADWNRNQFDILDETDGTTFLVSKHKKEKRYRVGDFSTPSLGQLQERMSDELVSPGDRVDFSQIVADVSELHYADENKLATFQAASQFNCLEFQSPSARPEDGVTDYISDRTQGPACAISCGPGTVFRNYFGMITCGNEAQTKFNQINNLESVLSILGNPFKVQSGYTIASNEQLRLLNGTLYKLTADKREEVKSALNVGIMEDTVVTSKNWGSQLKEQSQGAQLVTQVYGSALSIEYSMFKNEYDSNASREEHTLLWEPFARLVLEASYEATFRVAIENMHRHGGELGSNKLFLTALGGGCFGNDTKWIVDAIRMALKKFENAGLDVIFVSFGKPSYLVGELVREWTN